MLVLKQEAYDTLLAHALAEREEMACGILGGKQENGRRVACLACPLPNAAHSRERFSLDRAAHSRAVSDLNAKRLVSLGTWFCHREGDAAMTPYEIQSAHDRDGSYLVLSLREPGTPVLRSYRVWGGRADAEELVIEP